MRELLNNLLNHHYSNDAHKSSTDPQRSLQATRGFDRGFSVVDSFFQTRQKSGGKRWPTCKLKLNYHFKSFENT